MNRREFVTAAGAASLAPAGFTHESFDRHAKAAAQEYYEFRKYTGRSGPARARMDAYLKDAAIPAWNRLGIQHVGVFSVVHGPNAQSQYVLLPHPTLDSVGTLRSKLVADEKYQADAADFLSATLADPAFVRMESSLLRAFTGMPALAVPEGAADNAPRIFELRIYESHSEPAAIRKIEMFNNGEIEIFHKTGLTPVFFGEAIIGSLLPNLTYMLTFEDLADREASWDKFRADPDWATMSSDPYYRDTVSNITSMILRPAAFSQV